MFPDMGIPAFMVENYRILREVLHMPPTEAYQLAGIIEGPMEIQRVGTAPSRRTSVFTQQCAELAEKGIAQLKDWYGTEKTAERYDETYIIVAPTRALGSPGLLAETGIPCTVMIPTSWKKDIAGNSDFAQFLLGHELTHRMHAEDDRVVANAHPEYRRHAAYIDELNANAAQLPPEEAMYYLSWPPHAQAMYIIRSRQFAATSGQNSAQRLRERQSDLTSIAVGGQSAAKGFLHGMESFHDHDAGLAVNYALCNLMYRTLMRNGPEAAANALIETIDNPHVLREYMTTRQNRLVTAEFLEEAIPAIRRVAEYNIPQLINAPMFMAIQLNNVVKDHPSLRQGKSTHPTAKGRVVAAQVLDLLTRFEEHMHGGEPMAEDEAARAWKIVTRLSEVHDRLVQGGNGKAEAVPANQPVRLYIDTLDLLAGDRLRAHIEAEIWRDANSGISAAALTG